MDKVVDGPDVDAVVEGLDIGAVLKKPDTGGVDVAITKELVVVF